MVTITEERDALRAIGGELILRETWGSQYDYRTPKPSYDPWPGRYKVVEPATIIFIHISITNPSAYRSHAAHVRGIEAIGITRFPNTGISYNRVILFGVDTAYEGQPIGRRGAHTVNNHKRSRCNRFGSECPGEGDDLTAPNWNLNYNTRAYVYGALCEATATDSVIATMAHTIANDKKAGLMAVDAEIHGHRCVAYKKCPCESLWGRLHDLDRLVNRHLEGTVSYDDVFRTDDRLRNFRYPNSDNKHIWAETAVEWIGDALFHDMENKNTTSAAERISPRSAWQWGHAHAALGRAAIENKVIPMLQEIKAAQSDGARDQVLADIQADLQAARAERSALADSLAVVQETLDGVDSLLAQHAQGALDAAEVVDGIRALLHDATAPNA